jgi:sigma-B regulation protein RsbU (phosphoserine phosphatase)
MPNVLIADDQRSVLEALHLLLKSSGYRTEMATSPNALLAALESAQYDVVLLDLNYTLDTTSGREGLELLSRIQALDDSLPLVVMTAWGSMDLAIEAMRRGASDFIQKPWDNRQVLATIERQIERRRKLRALRNESAEQREQLGELQELHQHLFPRALPEMPGIGMAAGTRSARQVGGDFFDVQRSGDRLAACIADVAGKGLPAALLMANLQATVKPLMKEAAEPVQVCERVNASICDVTVVGKFVCFFYSVFDRAAGMLHYSNAGLNPPILVRANGAVERLAAADAVLGHFPDWHFSQSSVRFGAGDRLVMFTDGLTESCNAGGEEFGEDRLAAFVAEHRQLSADALYTSVMHEVSTHCGDHFSDDATLVILSAQ